MFCRLLIQRIAPHFMRLNVSSSIFICSRNPMRLTKSIFVKHSKSVLIGLLSHLGNPQSLCSCSLACDLRVPKSLIESALSTILLESTSNSECSRRFPFMQAWNNDLLTLVSCNIFNLPQTGCSTALSKSHPSPSTADDSLLLTPDHQPILWYGYS